MNLLSEVVFEQEVNGKKFRMSVLAGSTYQECHDFCVSVMKQVMQLAEDENKKRTEQQESTEQEPTVS